MSFPRTFTEYEVYSNSHFKYCFMAMGSPIEGWTYCRPNIFVDGTILKCKFAGTLFLHQQWTVIVNFSPLLLV